MGNNIPGCRVQKGRTISDRQLRRVLCESGLYLSNPFMSTELCGDVCKNTVLKCWGFLTALTNNILLSSKIQNS